MEIKKIIHIGDLHFKTYKRHQEFKEQFQKLFDFIKELRNEYQYDELRVAICGDIVDQKINVSNELTMILAWFFNKISEYCPVVMIAGNHDFLEHNLDRVDSLTPVIELLNKNNISYFKRSECIVDENIIWCPYSMFEDNKVPNIEEYRKKYGDTKKFIGLYHGPLFGSVTDMGFEVEGHELSIFKGLDYVLCADIHKRQVLKYNDIPIVYCGSFLQLNYGETVTKHGFLVWDVTSGTYEEHNLDTEYGFYQFKIESLFDIEEGKEQFTNR
jgi:DNA repair exonuclease SbcCD nuclease subunit